MLQNGPEGTQKPTRQRSSWVHLEISKKYGLEASSKCYEYQPLPVKENEEVKFACNMTIYADKKLKHGTPDITLLLKKDKEWIFTDIAVPADQNIAKTQNEQLDRYQELTLGVKAPGFKSRWRTHICSPVGDNIKRCKDMA